jgi:hypothetical protein
LSSEATSSTAGQTGQDKLTQMSTAKKQPNNYKQLRDDIG